MPAPTTPQPARIIVDDGDLCEIALRLPTESEQNAKLAEIVRLIREHEGQVE